ncbi:TetR/AcrR family transcriptional regulator [Microbacterium luticocti]|uniref:TetR/AcrR family transcriptional regulator n=1 Tax=Microbacterium luticocti TaxID=451764 RepID=UPI00040811D6|nr:TetR/AcrR family transcriptional regulator [Microbacterium luticocti]
MADTATGTRSRENTRARLLDAAFDVFADVGLDAASVEAVCERAGFTRGAFYSNFESKDELFLELMTTVADRKLAAITERVKRITDGDVEKGSPGEVVQGLVDASLDSRQGVLLMSEIRIRAMRDARMAHAYIEWGDGMRRRVADLIDGLVATYRLTLRMPSTMFAQTMLELWEIASVEAVIARLDDDATRELISARTQALAAAVVEGFCTPGR